MLVHNADVLFFVIRNHFWDARFASGQEFFMLGILGRFFLRIFRDFNPKDDLGRLLPVGWLHATDRSPMSL